MMSSPMSSMRIERTKMDWLRRENGATILLFAVLMGVAIMITALVIDHGKGELAGETIQRSADAAALSAVRRIDGTIDGWRTAKLRGLSLGNGSSSYWDTHDSVPASATFSTPTTDRGITADSPRFHVTIERGKFWADDQNPGKFKFDSWENLSNGDYHQARAYMFANAVRVRVKLDRLDTVLGRFLGLSSFSDIEREAIAISDSGGTGRMLPIGIQAGYLLHNDNPLVKASST
jgi:hypothetical protein